MELANNRTRRLGLRAKLAYSSGSLEEAMLGAAGVATMIFYNQVLGVSAALCGTGFLIASIVDAVSDPLAGAVSDSVRTRWGRRHPFMFVAAFPLAAFFFGLYQPPRGLTQTGLFAWFTAMLVGLRLAKTFFAVPYSALGAELTDDYNERTSVFGWSYVVGMIGGVALTVFVLSIIFPTTSAYSNGLLNSGRYFMLAMFGAVVVFAVVMFCTFMTADQIPYLHRQRILADEIRRGYNHALRELWRNIRALIVNPSYLSVCLCWLILAISGGVLTVTSTYAFIYAFHFTTEQIAIRSFVTLPGAFCAIYLSSFLTKLLDKKMTVVLTILWATFLIGLPFTLRLIGWFPPNGTVWVLIAFFGIWALGFVALPVVPIVIDSQLVDVADEHELNTGNRAEGLIFSIRSFAIKLTSGLGGLLGGFGLEYIGFPKHANIDSLSPHVIDGLLFMQGPLYYIIVYTGLGFAMMYKIDKKRHAEILAILKTRRNAGNSVEPVTKRVGGD